MHGIKALLFACFMWNVFVCTVRCKVLIDSLCC